VQPERHGPAASGRRVDQEVSDLVARDRLRDVMGTPVDRDRRRKDEHTRLERRRLDPEQLLEPDVEARLRGEDVDVEAVP
jgi:hypothetical protein